MKYLGLDLGQRHDPSAIAIVQRLEVRRTPAMDTFGPNMSLAKDLLDASERDAVLQYFEECRSFWKEGAQKLNQWSEAVQQGRTPSFGANLLYGA